MLNLILQSKILGQKSSWATYFDHKLEKKTYNEEEYKARQDLKQGNVYVLDCFFHDFKSTVSGGALCSVTDILLIEQTTFDQCETSAQYGGAVYYRNDNKGQCVLHRVCGSKCVSSFTTTAEEKDCATGLFAYIYTGNDLRYHNLIDDSSIVHTPMVSGQVTRYTIYQECGDIRLPGINLTANKATYQTALVCKPTKSDENALNFNITYSSFVNNTAERYNIIDLACKYNSQNAADATTKTITYTNILRNEQKSKVYWGIVQIIAGGAVFSQCCILENTGNYILYNAQKDKKIIIDNCTITKEMNKYQGYKTTNVPEKPFIFNLIHINTANCVGIYDAVTEVPDITAVPATMTPYIPTGGPSMRRVDIQNRHALSLLKTTTVMTFLLFKETEPKK